MKKLATIILYVISTNSLLASEILFEKANDYYAAEKYEDAIIIYDSIQQNGLQSKELYYNIGNTYYKLNDWSNAILYYEKTLKLDANNEDALYNLKLVQLKIVDKIDTIPSLFFKKWFNTIILFLPFESWAIISLILIWLSFIVYFIRKVKILNLPNKIIISLFIISIITFAFANKQYSQIKMQKSAIVFSSSVVVKSAPTLNANDLFTIHSGTKIIINDYIGEWLHIQLANGNKGWIMTSHCKNI